MFANNQLAAQSILLGMSMDITSLLRCPEQHGKLTYFVFMYNCNLIRCLSGVTCRPPLLTAYLPTKLIYGCWWYRLMSPYGWPTQLMSPPYVMLPILQL